MHLGPWPIPGVGPACVSVGRAGREKSVRKGEGVDSQRPICKAFCQTERSERSFPSTAAGTMLCEITVGVLRRYLSQKHHCNHDDFLHCPFRCSDLTQRGMTALTYLLKHPHST